ncbi:MAG: hypothetical protein AAF591_13960 [Verrucomicrobiota bacterium]
MTVTCGLMVSGVALGEERRVEEIVDEIEKISVERYRNLRGGSEDKGVGNNVEAGDGELWMVLQACARLRSVEAWTEEERRGFVGVLGKYLPGETAQRLLAELAQALSREKAAVVSNLEADLEEFREDQGPLILRAENSSELDDTLLELGVLKRRIVEINRRDSELQRLEVLADQYVEAVTIFQDYLLEHERGEPGKGRYRLNDICKIDWVGPPLIARSEVQTRTKVDESLLEGEDVEQKIDSILDQVSRIEDVQDAIVELERFRGVESERYDAIRRALVRLAEAESALQAETANRMMAVNLNLVDIPELFDVRNDLQGRIITKGFEGSIVVERAEEMSLKEWLGALGDAYFAQNDWERARRAYEGMRQMRPLGGGKGYYEILACEYLQSGENLEKAGFPALAVRIYLRAIQNTKGKGSDAALERLKAIREQDIERYRAGVNYYVESIPPGSEGLPDEITK